MAFVKVSEGGGNFLPIVQYDARSGRMFRADKDNGVTTKVDITRSFKAIMDFENVEIGFIHFMAGAAPDFRMVPYGADLPPQPTPDHKMGVRLRIKLSKECGGDVRELAGTSGAFLRGINAVHDEYLKLAPANLGKLPVITLVDAIPIESGSGTRKSTNYQPDFSLAGWAARPADLLVGTNLPAGGAKPTPSSAANAAANDAMMQKPAPAMAADDFGD